MSNPDTQSNEDKPLEDFHPSTCDKYEVLRGIYPNHRRETGLACSCGFEMAVNHHDLKVEYELLTVLVDRKMTKNQIVKLRDEVEATKDD